MDKYLPLVIQLNGDLLDAETLPVGIRRRLPMSSGVTVGR